MAVTIFDPNSPSRIPELPSGGSPTGISLLAIYNPYNDRTEHISIDALLNVGDNNYDWDSATTYGIGEIVTWGDPRVLWRSKVAGNLNNAPVEDANWEQVSATDAKGSLKKYAPGVYLSDVVYVEKDNIIYELESVVRPYNSTDFDAELVAGDWAVIGATIGGITIVGFWDADTNTPDISLLTLKQGQAYQVSVAGTTTLNGESDWGKNDLAVWNDTLSGNWFKLESDEEGKVGTKVVNESAIGDDKIIVYKSGADEFVYEAKPAGASTFISLSDTPAGYANDQIVVSTAGALEYSGSGLKWDGSDLILGSGNSLLIGSPTSTTSLISVKQSGDVANGGIQIENTVGDTHFHYVDGDGDYHIGSASTVTVALEQNTNMIGIDSGAFIGPKNSENYVSGMLQVGMKQWIYASGSGDPMLSITTTDLTDSGIEFSNNQGTLLTSPPNGVGALYNNSGTNDMTLWGRGGIYFRTGSGGGTIKAGMNGAGESWFGSTTQTDGTAIVSVTGLDDTDTKRTFTTYNQTVRTFSVINDGQVIVGTDTSNATGGLYVSKVKDGFAINSNGDILVSGDVEVGDADAYYFGDQTTDDSWRITRSGTNLVIQRLESSSWVTKDTILA